MVTFLTNVFHHGGLALRFAGILTFIAMSGLFGLADDDAPALPRIDDAKIMTQLPGENYVMPPRIFTPAIIEMITQRKVWMFEIQRGNATRAATWVQIPETRWKELIEPFAPVGSYGPTDDMAGKCPFCGKRFGGVTMTTQEFQETPFQATTNCCGRTLYAREADMPVDYPARPNRSELIPHMDGSKYEYRFFVPAGMGDAPARHMSNRRYWFCPAGEVWRARLDILMNQVLPDLGARVFQQDDPAAARTLAIVLDRIAEIYPGLPLVCANISHGFARSKDGSNYLTREAYLAARRPESYAKAFWYQGDYEVNYDKLNWGIHGWQDGVMWQAGNLAEFYDLLCDRPEVKAYSRDKYGDEGVWGERVRQRVLEEARLICNSTGSTRGNTISGWISGAVRLGIMTRDKFFFSKALGMQERYIPNGYFSDGLCQEGAFNYGSMLRSIIDNSWMLTEFGGLNLAERYPLHAVIKREGDWPVSTLLGVESMHGDEHAWFFLGYRGQEPFPVNYAEHERSQCYPEYGLAALRAGEPGSRLEAIMDFQSGITHTHHARLNLQLFYEGINLLPDIGYGTGAGVDGMKSPWKDRKYPFEIAPLLTAGDSPWNYACSGQTISHCTATVDGFQVHAPSTFQRYLGGQKLGETGYMTQFVEADGRSAFIRHFNPVSVFNRQLVTLTLPGGRSALVDIFRISGGQNHDLHWHIPAPDPATSLGAPDLLEEKTLRDLFTKRPNSFEARPPANDMARTQNERLSSLGLLGNLARWMKPDGMWQATWQVQPSRFAPITPEGQKRYEPWVKVLKDVNLRLWGMSFGSKTVTDEILRMRGPWPSNLIEEASGHGNLVPFKDALSYLIPTRTADTPGLESTFVNVIDVFTPGQGAGVETVQGLQPVQGVKSTGAGARLTVKTADAPAPMWVATTLDGGAFTADGVTLEGRLGVASPTNYALTLYDGTRFTAGSMSVTLDASWKIKLLGVIGDLSGSPGESALIVESNRPLPMDGALVGQMLTVYHQANELMTSGYRIEKISQYGAGRYRIDLRDTPPFIKHKLIIRELKANDPRVVSVDSWLMKGNGWGTAYEGCVVRFPRTGFASPMNATQLGAYHVDVITLKNEPPKDTLRVDDPVLIYTIQPGDEVVISSNFACTGRDTAEGVVLDIVSTGSAKLTMPGGFTQAWVLAGEKRRQLVATRENTSLHVQLGVPELIDGKATILLKR